MVDSDGKRRKKKKKVLIVVMKFAVQNIVFEVGESFQSLSIYLLCHCFHWRQFYLFLYHLERLTGLYPHSLVIRASVPKLVLNSVYEQNNQITKAVEEELEKEFLSANLVQYQSSYKVNLFLFNIFEFYMHRPSQLIDLRLFKWLLWTLNLMNM